MYGIIIEPELYETQINMLIYANTFKYTMYFRFVRYQYFGNCDSYLTLIRLEYIYVGLDIFSNAVNIMLFQMSLLKYLASPNRILVKSIFLKPTAYIFLKHRMHLIKMQMLWFYDWPTNSKKQRTFIKAIYGLYIYVYICIYIHIYITTCMAEWLLCITAYSSALYFHFIHRWQHFTIHHCVIMHCIDVNHADVVAFIDICVV